MNGKKKEALENRLMKEFGFPKMGVKILIKYSSEKELWAILEKPKNVSGETHPKFAQF